jgi:microcompartment protein CcmL/EutN
LELNSIAAGIQCGDAMLKGANVQLVSAQPVCAGKYLIVVGGMVADVSASLAAGYAAAQDSYVDKLLIPRVDERVRTAMAGTASVERKSAVGIIETFSLAAAVTAADAAVKAANVDLIEIRLGRGLGGKAFVVMTGDVGSVKASADAVESQQGDSGMLAKIVVIPALHPALYDSLF